MTTDANTPWRGPVEYRGWAVSAPWQRGQYAHDSSGSYLPWDATATAADGTRFKVEGCRSELELRQRVTAIIDRLSDAAEIVDLRAIKALRSREADNEAALRAQRDELLAALKQAERLNDLPRYLRANGSGALASIVAEVLDAQRAAIRKCEGA